MRVGVLVSGRGSNLAALIEAARADGFPAQIVLVGCNRGDAAAVRIATEAGIATCVVDRKVIPKRLERQQQLLERLHAAGVELVVLAGWDEILIDPFVQAFKGRLINTHPSLLPAFGGTMHAVEHALEHGVKVTGCTVHLVTDELDAGPILFQAPVDVRPDDDVESLHGRIRAEEHRLLPEAVRAFAEGRIVVEGRGARVLRSSMT